MQLLAWYWKNRHTYDWAHIFSRVVALFALVPVSSAAAERMFSYMKCMFAENRDSALEDTIATAVMLRANTNYRKNEEKRLK